MLYRELGEEKVAYYSSVVQFAALWTELSANGQYSCEVALRDALTDIRDDVIAHMNITMEICDMFRGKRKSSIMIHDGLLTLFILVLLHSYIGKN